MELITISDTFLPHNRQSHTSKHSIIVNMKMAITQEAISKMRQTTLLFLIVRVASIQAIITRPKTLERLASED